MATAPPAEAISNPGYPPIEGSPYVVGQTERTERWWYSDGIWLDQGQIQAVVGFGWTHWLADRGVQVADGELGEEYARRLQVEAQRIQGEPEGPQYGARIDSAARVLQARGLVEDCYSFDDIGSVVSTLLERGPVVASLAWPTEFAQPDEMQGWMVGRLRDTDLGDSPATICVLLNGISLDLTIDGVTGFVRMKNCWGRQWGDEGHILISIADLRAAMRPEYSLLAIPAAAALRPGVRQDVATDGVPYRPREVRFEQSSIGGDAATRRDTVGAGAYAQAIARGIQHPDTKAPLTIGIKAAWGAGKTSLMRMIQDALEWPDQDGSGEDPRKIRLTEKTAKQVAAKKKSSVQGPQSLTDITYRALLRKLKMHDRAHVSAPSVGDGRGKLRAELGEAGTEKATDNDPRWRPTVWFNPWMYQTGDQVWAGLAYEIIRQVTNRMTGAERENFWLHLNRERVDEQAVRRKIYELVLNRVVPWAICGLVALAAGIAVFAIGASSWLGTAFTVLGSVVALAGGGASGWNALNSRVGAGMSDLVRPSVTTSRAATGKLGGIYDEVVENPDYRSRSGYLYLVHTDIERVLDLVATPERPLVIFVDDLDRCSPPTVVQVIEAINIFVAGAYTKSIFVIAMEPEMVAAHIEAAYADLVVKLAETGGRTDQGQGLGWRFLEKIVQLPLALPQMQPDKTTTFFESLFPATTRPDGSTSSPPAGRADGSSAEQNLEAATLSEAVSIAGSVQPDSDMARQIRRVIERKLTADDPDVQHVIGYASGCLRHNPREIKRFVNLFRFYTMIYAERQIARMPTPTSLQEVAKLAVLGIRWPNLLSTFALAADSDRTLFELLEDPPSGDDPAQADGNLSAVLKAAGLSDAMTACLMAPELQAFIRSEPKVGKGARGYL